MDSPSSHTPPESLRRPSLPLHLPSDFDISSTSSHDTTSVGPSSLSTAIIPPTPTKPGRSNRDRGPSTPPPRVSTDSGVPSDHSHVSSTLPTSDVTNDGSQRNNFPSQDTRTPLIPHNPPPTVAFPNVPPRRSSAVSPNLTAPEPAALDPKRLARSSRISLPDEASRYITNMVESPIPSPAGGLSRFPQSNVGFVSESSSSTSRGVTSVPGSPLTHAESHHPPFRVENSADTDTLREAAFLDMDDEEEDDETPDAGIVVPVVTSSGVNIPAAPTVVKSSSKSSEPSAEGLEVPSPGRESRPLQAPRVEMRFSSDNLEDLARNAPVPMAPESQPIASFLSPEQHRFEYKATMLTTGDLPYTKVHVEGSNIRPNDRGKEVLSFIILVQTANKEWRIEKLYSDVLALDGRVRMALDGRIRVAAGKSHAKKIGTLPDSKLFKDNAPAKVDLRKVGSLMSVLFLFLYSNLLAVTVGVGDLFPDLD
jgi:RalA-binding protein 1